MKVSLDWIREFADLTAPPQEIADRLTMAGLEIEGMEQADGDTLLEVNVTPNRPDCLSILGVAREAAAAFSLPVRFPDTDIREKQPPSDVPVEILDPQLCGRYTGRVISGVGITATPDWIRRRLERCGIRSLNNNVVDITNYVLLELGHPLHAFDADRLAGRRIRVARAGEERTIRTLDAVERKAPAESLLIWDGGSPVAIAGIMGGEGSGVTSGTVNIFLESAYFEPFSIRRTSKALGLRSESSYRFERGTDIEFLATALDRAALLICRTGGGTIHAMVDAYPEKYVPQPVEVVYERINALLGTTLGSGDMARTLGSIGLRIEDRGDRMLVTPPAFRRDIRAAEDVIEEVARLHGYGNIPVRTPRAPLSDGAPNRRMAAVGRAGETMRKSGFTEVINYSFMNAADLDMLGISANDERRRHIEVKNPLRQEDSHMRTTLLPALVNNLIYNASRGIRDVRLYEIAKVYIDDSGPLPRETLRLGGIFFRENAPSLWKEDGTPFFIVKGGLEALCAEFRLEVVSYVPSSEPFLHPGKAADLRLQDRRIGYLGELGPTVTDKLDLKTGRPEIVVFELDLDALFSLLPERRVYAPFPRYPAVDRDIAVIMDESIPAAGVIRHIRDHVPSIIETVELFDVYKGKHVPEGQKSLAFRIVYRSRERTLTDSEVEDIHAGLVASVLKKTGGALRSS